MRDLLNWNVSLGRWADVQVRLHVSFLVLIVAVLHLCTGAPTDRIAGPALAGLTILFLSVVAHELGHCWAVWKCGGRIERVVLGPWGGLTYLYPTREQQVELVTALAGPMVNLALSLAATSLLLGLAQPILPVFQPFALPLAEKGLTAVHVLYLIAWINWLIVLVNILPAYPLDGARALRAMLRPRFGFRTAVVVAWRTGMFTAAGLFLVAWLLRHDFDKASLACSLLGIFLYFSSWQEAERLHEPDAVHENASFDERYDEEEEPHRHEPIGPLRRWLDRRRQMRLARQIEQEREEESRVDEVLARLHSLGPQALSPEDRALLKRVSARYRERQQG